MNEFSREEMLIGTDEMEVLARSRVAVFGLGGVGSHAAEALARGGVGKLFLADHDAVSLTNSKPSDNRPSQHGGPELEVKKSGFGTSVRKRR